MKSRFSGHGHLDTSVGQFRERVAMILGMNPRTLRESLYWNLFMWPKKHHWALVAQPTAEFQARIVDDFAYSAVQCFNAEVSSKEFFLILELLSEGGFYFPMLSVKTDFVSDRPNVQPLGLVGPITLQQIEREVLQVLGCYKSYSLIGCNCQHFAADLALALGAARRPDPVDERLAKSAASGANTLGAAGVSVAACAAAGAAGTSVLGLCSSGASAALGASAVLGTVAASASMVSVVGGLTLMGVAHAYEAVRDSTRESCTEDVAAYSEDSTSPSSGPAPHSVE